jgi:hypothetical protein
MELRRPGGRGRRVDLMDPAPVPPVRVLPVSSETYKPGEVGAPSEV